METHWRELSALAVTALVGLAEWLHARRTRRVAFLAFGPQGTARSWVKWARGMRAMAFGALTWGFLTLTQVEGRVAGAREVPEGGYRHILIVLDVSPSMQLRDAGPAGNRTRMQRAGEVLMSVLERTALDQARVSVIAFYTEARPVVVDTFDIEIIKNILNDLPLDQGFSPGKTKIFTGLESGFAVAKPWEPGSATLILVSDGDTTPDSGMPLPPRSIAKALVVGVGNARVGKFIDGHQSRQNASKLRQLAARLRGEYHDANEKHLPSEKIAALAEVVPMVDQQEKGERELALALLLMGGGILSCLPVALAWTGASWPPRRPERKFEAVEHERNRMRTAFSREAGRPERTMK